MMNGESEGEGSRTREIDRSDAVDFETCRTVAEPRIVFEDSDARILGIEDELDIVLACLAPDEGR